MKSPKAMLSGTLSGNITVRKLVCPKVRESLSGGLAAGIIDLTFNKCLVRKFPCPGIRIPA